MSVFIPLCLSLLAYVGLQPSLQVFDTSCSPYTEGYVKEGDVYVCEGHSLPRETVINHEVVHLVQSNLGVDTLLPPALLDFLIDERLDERERLAVLVIYNNSDYMAAEFEARVLQDLHPRVIMSMLRISQDYAALTSS